jgi:hypothetical protein
MKAAIDPNIEKIKKLILHQQSAEEIGSLKEAEAFAAKIQNLLNKYNISLDQITFEELKDNVIKEWMSCKIKSVSDTLGYFIMHPIAKYNWCRVYNAGKGNMVLVGTPENIAICQMLYDLVIPMYVSIGKGKYKESGSKKGLDTYLREFLQGCANGLEQKFKSEQQIFIQANSSTTGLIIRNDKAVEEYVKENMRTTTSKRKAVPNTGAYTAGVVVEKNTNLGKQIE